MRTLLLVVALLGAGCLGQPSADPTPAPSPTPSTPMLHEPASTELYNSTLSFGVGAVGNQPLDVPAGASALTLSVTWRAGSAPTTASAGVLIDITDKDGAVVMRCERGVAITSNDDDTCEKTDGIDNPPYALNWQGTGNVEADVVVTAR